MTEKTRSGAAPKKVWRRIGGRANHFLDTEVYHIAQAKAYAVETLGAARREQQPARPRGASIPADAGAVLRQGN